MKKMVSWNVNGIRATIKKGFYDVFHSLDADIFCLQETKAQDEQVAEALFELTNYSVFYTSAEKKGYSGTAIISKEKPLSVFFGIDHSDHDNEGRVVTAEYEDFFFINVYVPNSGADLKRLDYRAEWDREFTAYLESLQKKKPIVVTGDFNVAHQPIDLARPKENYDKTSGYTQVEIDGFNNLLSIGLVDTFRYLHPEKVQYTFWNQRFNARERNVGWRIDYFLVSESLQSKIKEAAIHDDIFGSDHCPLSLVLDI